MATDPEPAAERWRRELERWAIPEHLLARAAESPWGWPPAVLDRMRRDRAAGDTDPTVELILAHSGEAPSVLDVGAGVGRLAIPLARRGCRVTAVEPSAEMAAEIRSASGGLPVEIVEERWPDAAASLGPFDVALSAHVVYDVPDIRPFLAALHRAAREVVVECGPDHPRSGLRELFRALHGLERPSGPTAEDLIEIVADVAGGRPEVARRTTRRGLRFADRAELLTFYRIRLALPEERTPELEERLDPEIREEGGWLTVGHGVRETVTIWWTT